MESLAAEFRARGPWITRFDVAGAQYGGTYHAASDPRLLRFFQLFPNPGRILELGSLEGGHSVPLAGHAREVVAIEARSANIAKARWVQSLYGTKNLRFLETDLESATFAELGTFDVVFNLGLLYHLPEPWRLLRRLSRITRSMYLWTHVCPPRWRRSKHPRTQREGYDGLLYPEHGSVDPLSGMSQASFWPTKRELVRMLKDSGFDSCNLLAYERSHIHGPAVLLECRSQPVTPA